VDIVWLDQRACCTPLIFVSIFSYMASCLALVFYIISRKAYDMATMMNSKSSSVSTVCSLVLVALDFFCEVGFMGVTFLFLDGSASSTRSLGSVTSTYFC
jgi:Na+-driven multidrug efflux pump